MIIKEVTFEQLVEYLKPRIDFHVRRHQGKIPGYDPDDIRQELLIELWKKLNRLPTDMVTLDYRFTKWLDTVFNRRIIDIHRSLLVSQKNKTGEYRDNYHYTAFIGVHTEMLDEFHHRLDRL